jgi:hypothetical protein
MEIAPAVTLVSLVDPQSFEAKYIKPSDVPDRAPELDNMKVRVCH